jgi:hypothetical protein
MNIEKLALEKNVSVLTQDIHNVLNISSHKEKSSFVVSALRQGIMHKNHNLIDVMVEVLQKENVNNHLLNKIDDYGLSLTDLFVIALQNFFYHDNILENFNFILSNQHLKTLLIETEKNGNSLFHSLCHNDLNEVVQAYLNTKQLTKNIDGSEKKLTNLLVGLLDKDNFEMADLLLSRFDIFNTVDVNQLKYLLPEILDYNNDDKTKTFQYLVFEKKLNTLKRSSLENNYMDYVKNILGFTGSLGDQYMSEAFQNTKDQVAQLVAIFGKRDLSEQLNTDLANSTERKKSNKL